MKNLFFFNKNLNIFSLIVLAIGLLFSCSITSEARTYVNTIFPFNQAPTATRTEISDLAYDSQGNMLVAGTALGATTFQFETGSDKKKVSFANPMQAFVVKYNRAGKLIWVKTWTHVGNLGSTPTVRTKAIVVTSNDEILITGNFNRIVDFNPGAGVFSVKAITENAVEDNDLFLLKLNKDGNFVWVKTASAGKDFANLLPNDIALDKQGNILVTGSQGDAKEPALINHTFIKKWDNQGNSLWTKTILATASLNNMIKKEVTAQAITIDNGNNIYLGGQFKSTTDFDPSNGKFELKSSEGDGFLCQLNPNGDFVWAKKIGGMGNDSVQAIAIDKNNKLLVGGDFSGQVDFNPGAPVDSRTASGSSDTFFSQFSLNGAYGWTKTFGGADSRTTLYDLAVDSQNNILSVSLSTPIFANSAKIDLDPDPNKTSLFTITFSHLFSSKFSNNGTFTWGRDVEVHDSGNLFSPPKIAVDSANFVAFGGTFKGKTDFDPSPSGGDLILGFNEIPVFCAFTMELNKNGFLMRPDHDWGDHNSEVLWQNQTNFASQVQVMTYDVVKNEPKSVFNFNLVLPDLTNNWILFGSGDFNSDANPELVWSINRRIIGKNLWAVSFLKGFLPTNHVIMEVGPMWELACIGDFNGDTQSDILWHNTDTHKYLFNFMNNLGVIQSQFLDEMLPLNQLVKACGDFDRDGNTDLVVQNQDTGEVFIHFLEGNKLKNIPNNPALLKNVFLNPVWEVAGSGDFNYDGHADLVFQLNFLPNTRTIDFVKTNTVTKLNVLASQLPGVWKIHNR